MLLGGKLCFHLNIEKALASSACQGTSIGHGFPLNLLVLLLPKSAPPPLLGIRWICICNAPPCPHCFLQNDISSWNSSVSLRYTQAAYLFAIEQPEQHRSWDTKEEDQDLLGSWAVALLYIDFSHWEITFVFSSTSPLSIVVSGNHSSTRKSSFTLRLYIL